MEVLAQIPKVHLPLMNVLTQHSTGTHILLLLMRVLTKIREVLVRTGQIHLLQIVKVLTPVHLMKLLRQRRY